MQFIERLQKSYFPLTFPNVNIFPHYSFFIPPFCSAKTSGVSYGPVVSSVLEWFLAFRDLDDSDITGQLFCRIALSVAFM